MQVIGHLGQPRRRPPRRRRLRTISTLPTLVTLGNLICGFAAIHFCTRAMFDAGAGVAFTSESTFNNQVMERLLPSFLSIGAGLIFLGLILDGLDGRIARITNRTSDFGGQLDSMADMVTFGVAPAMLMIAVMTTHPDIADRPGPFAGGLAARAVWMMGAAYAACAAMRLARYNVEHTRPNEPQNFFQGLPSPGAAITVASLILLHQHLVSLDREYARFLAMGLPFVTLALGLLMISRIRYVHFANVYLRGRRPMGHVVLLLAVLGVFWWYKELTLAVVLGAYAVSGPAAALYRRFNAKPEAGPAPAKIEVSVPIDHQDSGHKSGPRSA
jgi:CDP-diacylglycerol--serine O-phosphatidyltransferase